METSKSSNSSTAKALSPRGSGNTAITGSNLLSSLPMEVKGPILQELLICSEPGKPIKDGTCITKDDSHIHISLLRTDAKNYQDGAKVFYGENEFRFSSANALEDFVSRANATIRNTDLINLVELYINLWFDPSGREEWLHYLRSASFQTAFPQLERLEIRFNIKGGYDEKEFRDIVEALKANAKAWDVRVPFINGEEACRICEGMEESMMFPRLPKTEEQKAQEKWVKTMKEYGQSVHPTDKPEQPVSEKDWEKPVEAEPEETEDRGDNFW